MTLEKCPNCNTSLKTEKDTPGPGQVTLQKGSDLISVIS